MPFVVVGRAREGPDVKVPRLSASRVVMLLAAAVVGYFVFSAAGDVLLSHQLSQDEQDLRSEVADLSRQRDELEAIRAYLRTDEYIEGVARRLLGLVRPGETLFIVSSSVEPTPGPTPEAGPGADETWWEKLYNP
jgi:cell division protein FtsB